MAKRRQERRPGRRSERGRQTPATTGADARLRFEPLHGILLAVGVAVAIVAFVLLDRGSISLAPLLLIVVYLVLVPVALSLPARGGDDARDVDSTGGNGGSRRRG